jgi:glycosyltransferase involved in cell wall biosynthesis
MTGLSAVIITHNEEVNLPRCLESVKFADEIVVVDSHSTDRTRDIAQHYGARLVLVEWQGFGAAKQAGVDASNGSWILSIDADEEVPEALREEIRRVVEDDGPQAGYEMPRKTNFLGRWINHSNWYPDYVLRLFRKADGHFNDAVVHEKVVVNGPVGRLRNDLLHYSYPSLDVYFEKFNRYTTIGAVEAYKAGKRSGWPAVAIKPVAAFVKHYVTKQGFRDGLEGFLISVLSSAAVMVKYAKLRDIERKEKELDNL